MYLKSIKIGNVELKNNILLAPMAGITDLPFRKICEKYEPGLVCTEMASAKAIHYNDEKTKKLLNVEGEKRPIAVQIFGNDIEAMISATKYVNNIADIIDINMGCPAPKVVKNGDGSKLLQSPEQIKQIVETVVKNSKVPVTVKMRTGWDKDHIVAEKVAKIIEKAGASAITVHGRTREEFYSGTADWEIIKKVKQTVNIPVIGNGDIIDGPSAERIFKQTGVDGIMIGRATLGAPWIIEEIKAYLEGNKEYKQINKEQILETIQKQLELEIKEKGELTAIKEMRKHIAWYVKGLPNATKIKIEINKIEQKNVLLACLLEYFNSI